MKFQESELSGAYLILPEPMADARGSFARTFCSQEFASHGLAREFPQCSFSSNLKRGTLRGMHYQAEPKPESKLVRCTRGAILDVVLDLRPRSATYLRWRSYELTSENHAAVYVPPGFAHGFQTLTDDTEVFYQISENFVSELARGARWDDSAFGISWPVPNPILSDRDRAYSDFKPDRGASRGV